MGLCKWRILCRYNRNYTFGRAILKTVKEYKKRTGSRIEVVFNVFKDRDKEIYRKLLTQN